MTVKPAVAVVTGANRGIGQGICHLLCKYDKPIVVYAASRAGTDLGFSGHDHVKFEYPKLDISDVKSVTQLAETIKNTHKELDVLINNAGLNVPMDEQGDRPAQIKLDIFNVNYRGTLRMCKTFLPIMREGGRIVNLSSTASSLSNYSQPLKAKLRNPSSWDDLESLASEWEGAVQKGSEGQQGWPSASYSISKAFMNSMTILLAQENPTLVINSCCPGWVDTEMGGMVGSQPPKSIEEGAKVPYHLAFKDIHGVTGRYWGNDSVSGRGEGKIQPW